MGHVAGVAGLDDRSHYRGIIDLLVFVEFVAARNACGVEGADHVDVLAKVAIRSPSMICMW